MQMKKKPVRNLYHDLEAIKIEKIDITELAVFIMVLFYYINCMQINRSDNYNKNSTIGYLWC